MGLCEDVRRHCAEVARRARLVSIEQDALAALEPAEPAPPDPERHLLEGSRADRAAFWLTLDTINFGSGWFPTLRKPQGRSGYETVAGALTERFRVAGPWTGAELRSLEGAELADVLGQDPGHPLIGLYARALRDLGAFLSGHGDSALRAVESAVGSAERLAAALAAGMPLMRDPGFYKRAQITPSDLAAAGVARFHDLDRLTIFADNVVPHVLRVDGVLRYEPGLAAHIDRGELLAPGGAEREIRACALQACELLSARTGGAPRELDAWLWQRGRGARYKALPRHRTRTVAY